MFGRMAERGAAIIAWVKRDLGAPWPKRMFRMMKVTKRWPGNLTVTSEKQLAQKKIKMPYGLVLRQIRILEEYGRQKALAITDMRSPMARIARRLPLDPRRRPWPPPVGRARKAGPPIPVLQNRHTAMKACSPKN